MMQPYRRREASPSPTEPVKTTSSCVLAALHGSIMRIMEAATLAEAATGEAVDTSGMLQEVPTKLNCDACGSWVRIVDETFVAPGCTSSGSCELSWAELHDAQYRDASDQPVVKRVPCGGFLCAATVIIADKPGGKPEVDGMCTVDIKGSEWRKSAMQTLNSMHPVYPEAGFEPFDGDRSYIPPAE